jgi:hypothetical protein
VEREIMILKEVEGRENKGYGKTASMDAWDRRFFLGD